MAAAALPKILEEPHVWIPLAAVGAACVLGAAAWGIRKVLKPRPAKMLPKVDVQAYNAFPIAP